MVVLPLVPVMATISPLTEARWREAMAPSAASVSSQRISATLFEADTSSKPSRRESTALTEGGDEIPDEIMTVESLALKRNEKAPPPVSLESDDMESMMASADPAEIRPWQASATSLAVVRKSALTASLGLSGRHGPPRDHQSGSSPCPQSGMSHDPCPLSLRYLRAAQ